MSAGRVRVLAAPGPVSYPVVAASIVRPDLVEVSFGKEGLDADVVVDSVVSLISRGLRVDLTLVRDLMYLVPDGRPEGRVAVWRAGSAVDVQVRALARLMGLDVSPVYFEDWPGVMKAFRSGSVTRAVLPAGLIGELSGTPMDSVFESLGIRYPGACGAHLVNPSSLSAFTEAYKIGIKHLREDEGLAEEVARRLQVGVSPEFVRNTARRARYVVEGTGDYSDFLRAVSGLLGSQRASAQPEDKAITWDS